MIKSIFISRDNFNCQKMYELKHTKVHLYAFSLIEFLPVDFSLGDEAFDVVFFNSPRCIEFFLSKTSIANIQVACMGQGTLNHLRKYNLSADYVGTESSNPEKIFSEFSQWLGNRKVMVPHGDKSRLSIKKHVPSHQIQTKLIYKTVYRENFVPSCDIYIFSSSSNVEAFFSAKNSIKNYSKIVSWGKSTTHALKQRGIQPTQELNLGREDEIYDIVSNLL